MEKIFKSPQQFLDLPPSWRTDPCPPKHRVGHLSNFIIKRGSLFPLRKRN